MTNVACAPKWKLVRYEKLYKKLQISKHEVMDLTQVWSSMVLFGWSNCWDRSIYVVSWSRTTILKFTHEQTHMTFNVYCTLTNWTHNIKCDVQREQCFKSLQYCLQVFLIFLIFCYKRAVLYELDRPLSVVHFKVIVCSRSVKSLYNEI